jgi:hypothetical protein
MVISSRDRLGDEMGTFLKPAINMGSGRVPEGAMRDRAARARAFSARSMSLAVSA